MRPVRAERFSFEGKEYQLRVWTADEVTYTAAAFLDGTQARCPSTTSQTAMTSMASSRRPVAMLPRGAASLPTSSASACGCRDAARPLSLPLTLRAFRWNETLG